MQITIKQQTYPLTPLSTFRQQWQLPPEFSVTHFEPKNSSELGSIEGSGQAMLQMKDYLVQLAQRVIKPQDLLGSIDLLANLFRSQLQMINTEIGLRSVEVDFAVAGFEDVLRATVYHLYQLRVTYPQDVAKIRQLFDFETVYQNWLAGSTHVSAKIYIYPHDNHTFQIQLLNDAYGRMGMQVRVSDQTYYVMDTSLGCPAAKFMHGLCTAVAEVIINSNLNF